MTILSSVLVLNAIDRSQPAAASPVTLGPVQNNLVYADGDMNGITVPQLQVSAIAVPAPIDPLSKGANPTGVADSAPAIRAAIAESSHIIFSPGIYTLCSLQTGPYISVQGPKTGVLIQNKSKFTIDFGAANFTICNAISGTSIGLAYFMFDKDKDYTVIGGNLIGNMTGKTTGALTAGICTFNSVDFTYTGQTFAGDWQSQAGGGSGYCGDYMVNGVFLGSRMYGITVGWDLAFLRNVKLLGFNIAGENQGGFGEIGVSIVYDIPMVGNNTTAYSIDDSSDVTINGSATGFAAGWGVFSGSGYTIDGVYSGNLGGTSQPAWGGIIGYNNGGVGSSVGHPPHNIIVRGQYAGNGSATALGGGILVENGNITNSDVISRVRVDATLNNNINAGLAASGSSHIADVSANVDCAGAGQIDCLNSNIAGIAEEQRFSGSRGAGK
jgi:hypothetical protein